MLFRGREKTESRRKRSRRTSLFRSGRLGAYVSPGVDLDMLRERREQAAHQNGEIAVRCSSARQKRAVLQGGPSPEITRLAVLPMSGVACIDASLNAQGDSGQNCASSEESLAILPSIFILARESPASRCATSSSSAGWSKINLTVREN